MTLKQKQNAERPWLRQELLVVTKHLASLLEASNLSETDKRLRALVHHIIVRDSEDVAFYRNIHSRILSSYLGNNYSDVLNWLLENDCLDINHIYSADVDSGFSKSYRIPSLTEDTRDTSLTAIAFNHERIRFLAISSGKGGLDGWRMMAIDDTGTDPWTVAGALEELEGSGVAV